MSVVQRIVVDDYIIVYLHSGAPRHSMPSIPLFHKFYRMVDRRYYTCASIPSEPSTQYWQASQTAETSLYSAPHILGPLHAANGTAICEVSI